MSVSTFNTSNDSYKQLISGGSVFNVPRFQRDYSWKEEQWEDLWSDIMDLVQDKETESHYMGYLVLQPKPGGNSLDIIDGQQRMTTLSLIVLSGMRKIQDLVNNGIEVEQNTKRLEELRRSYIGQMDTVSLSVSSKLTLNRNNDDYYQTYLTTLREMPARNFKASEHLMRKATEWFQRKLNDYLNSPARSENPGPTVAELIDTVSRGLFFTVITVDDDLNAYKVFETLNARGVKLAAPDLLKNYLFSLISRNRPSKGMDKELDAVEIRWTNILQRLQSDKITAYLRAYWGANHSFVRQIELFKVIKRNISTREDAYRLVEGLEDGVETYLSLIQPDESSWTSDDKENAKLLKMFNVKQPFAVLMAMHQKIPDGFSQVLRAIVNITFRYNVISNLQANEQERTYSKVAIGISNGDLKNAGEVIRKLNSIYPSDDVFKANFSDKSFDTSNSRNKQVVRYILGKIEAHTEGHTNTSQPRATIEHVLPENPSENWSNFNEADAVSHVYRIGNMIQLEEALNREASNHSFEEKKKIFKKSNLKTASDIAKQTEDWNKETISTRQKKMAKVAACIWRVDQFHKLK